MVPLVSTSESTANICADGNFVSKIFVVGANYTVGYRLSIIKI